MLAKHRLPLTNEKPWQGSGLGYRPPLSRALLQHLPSEIDFLELAPENWIHVGGRRAKDLQILAEHYPIICHGLSLSIGGPAPLDQKLLKQIKEFLRQFNVPCYSEHLSYSNDGHQLYDLLPIPFTEEAVFYVVDRIKQTQDFLERNIALENVSYYCAPSNELTELEFITAVLAESQCELLLDVNNIYVNSINHGYDPTIFLEKLQGSNVAYIHIAGHEKIKYNLAIDTHGARIIDPVWVLLKQAYLQFGPLPTLLERDSDIPPLENLLEEIAQVKALQDSQRAITHA